MEISCTPWPIPCINHLPNNQEQHHEDPGPRHHCHVLPWSFLTRDELDNELANPMPSGWLFSSPLPWPGLVVYLIHKNGSNQTYIFEVTMSHTDLHQLSKKIKIYPDHENTNWQQTEEEARKASSEKFFSYPWKPRLPARTLWSSTNGRTLSARKNAMKKSIRN